MRNLPTAITTTVGEQDIDKGSLFCADSLSHPQKDVPIVCCMDEVKLINMPCSAVNTINRLK